MWVGRKAIKTKARPFHSYVWTFYSAATFDHGKKYRRQSSSTSFFCLFSPICMVPMHFHTTHTLLFATQSLCCQWQPGLWRVTHILCNLSLYTRYNYSFMQHCHRQYVRYSLNFICCAFVFWLPSLTMSDYIVLPLQLYHTLSILWETSNWTSASGRKLRRWWSCLLYVEMTLCMTSFMLRSNSSYVLFPKHRDVISEWNCNPYRRCAILSLQLSCKMDREARALDICRLMANEHMVSCCTCVFGV